MPKVSVCMAAYNHERYVGRAIQSVLDQTYQDWELIISDDASTDHTPEIISDFSDPRIKFFRFKQNQGIGATTFNCIRESQGEYIAILNSDDMFLHSKLEKQVRILDNQPNVAAVFTHTWFIDSQGKDYNKLNIGFYTNKRNIFNKSNRSRFEWLNYFFYHHNTLCDPSVMTRREVFTTIAPVEDITGDFGRWVRTCLQHEIFIIPEILLNFRIHAKNTSGNWLEPPSKISWPLLLILRNYLEITAPDDLRLIFPGFFDGMELDTDLIPYYLALPALKIPSLTYKAFAVDAISRVIMDPLKAEKLRKNHGFGIKDFQKICRSNRLL